MKDHWSLGLMPSFSNSVIPNKNKSTLKSLVAHLNPRWRTKHLFCHIFLYLQHLCKQTQTVICQGGMGSSIIQISHSNKPPPPGFCCFRKVLSFVTGIIHHCCKKDNNLPASQRAQPAALHTHRSLYKEPTSRKRAIFLLMTSQCRRRTNNTRK